MNDNKSSFLPFFIVAHSFPFHPSFPLIFIISIASSFLINICCLFIHLIGTFLRIVDAVKGPFHQSPAPFPTYLVQKDDPEFPNYSLFAPVSESDSQKLKEPEDAY